MAAPTAGQPNAIQALLQSLIVCNDGKASQQQRQQAYQLQEQFKANVAVCLPSAFQLLSHTATQAADVAKEQQMTIVAHFALHTLEHVVQNKWNGLDDSAKGVLKNSLTQLLSSGHPLVERRRMIREKLALVISATATREWPQRWPSLVADLLAASSRGLVAARLSVLILRNLAEEVRSFNPKLPAQRRKQLQQGLSSHLPQIFGFLSQMLLTHFNTYKSARSEDAANAVTACLECVGSFLEFAAAKFAFQPQFVPLLLEMVKVPVFFEPVIDILRGLALRKRAKLEAPMCNQMLPVWNLVVMMLSSFSQPSFLQQAGAEQQISYMQRCLNLLLRLLTHWRDDIAASTEQLNTFRTRMLSTLAGLVAHASVSIASGAIEIFSYLLRNTGNSVISKESQQNVVGSLFNVVLDKVVKQEYNEQLPYSDQYHDEVDFDRASGDYRSLLLTLTTKLTYREPLVVVTLLGQRLTKILSASPDSLPKVPRGVNERGYLTVHAAGYRLFEAASVVLETVLRVIPYQTLTKSPPSPTHTAVANVLNTLLSYQSQEPLMIHRLATALSYFTDLYKSTPSTLAPVLTRLFRLVVFNTPQEKDTPLSQLSEDVCAARKRACATLMTIGVKDSSALMGAFQSCVQQVLTLVRAKAVTEGEKLCLYEFVVAVSNSMPNYQQQHTFVLNILQDSLKLWDGEEMKNWITKPGAFMRLLLPESKASRKMLYSTLSTFNAVLNRLPLTAEQQAKQRLHALGTIFSDEQKATQHQQQQSQQPQQQNHPSAAILFSVVSGVLRLSAILHSLWSPEGRAQLPAQCRGLLQLSAVERKVYMGEKALKSERLSDPQNYIRTWINQVRDACYRLLSRGARAGTQFFTSFPPRTLVPTIFSHMQHMEHLHLKMLVDRVVVPYAEHCPPQLFASSLGPVLRGVFVTIFSRLSTEWAARLAVRGQGVGAPTVTATASAAGAAPATSAASAGGTGTTVDVTDDILAEKALRDLTRSFSDALMMMFEVLEFSPESKWRAEAAARRGAGEDVPKRRPAAPTPTFGLTSPTSSSAFDAQDDSPTSEDTAASAPTHGEVLVKYVLAQPEVSRPLLASLCGLISWPDSHCNVRASHIGLHLLPHALAVPSVYPMLLELAKVSLQCLMALRPADLELSDTNAHHITLLREMYMAKTAQALHAGMQQLLLMIPSVSAGVLQSLEQELFDPETDKKKVRRVFKAFCGSTIVGIRSQFKSSKEAAIKDLPAHESLAQLGRRVSDELPAWGSAPGSRSGSPTKATTDEAPQYTIDFS